MALQYFVVTSINSFGLESLPSTEHIYNPEANFYRIIWGTDYGVELSWSAVPGATAYRIYHGTSSGVYYEYIEQAGTSIQWATQGLLGEQPGTTAGSPPAVAADTGPTWKSKLGSNTGVTAPTSGRNTNFINGELWIGKEEGRLLIGPTLSASMPVIEASGSTLTFEQEDGDFLSSVTFHAGNVYSDGNINATETVSGDVVAGSNLQISHMLYWQFNNWEIVDTAIPALEGVQHIVIGDGWFSSARPRGPWLLVHGDAGSTSAHRQRNGYWAGPTGAPAFNDVQWIRPRSSSNAYFFGCDTSGGIWITTATAVNWTQNYFGKTSALKRIRASYMGDAGDGASGIIQQNIAVGIGGGASDKPIVNFGTSAGSYSQPTTVPDNNATLNDAYWYDNYPIGQGTYRWVVVGNGGIIWISGGSNDHTTFTAHTPVVADNLNAIVGSQRMGVAHGGDKLVYNENILTDTWNFEQHTWFGETFVDLLAGSEEVSPMIAYLVTEFRVIKITFAVGSWSWSNYWSPTSGPYIDAAYYDRGTGLLAVASAYKGAIYWRHEKGDWGTGSATIPFRPTDTITTLKYMRGTGSWWIGGHNSAGDPIVACTTGGLSNVTF